MAPLWSRAPQSESTVGTGSAEPQSCPYSPSGSTDTMGVAWAQEQVPQERRYTLQLRHSQHLFTGSGSLKVLPSQLLQTGLEPRPRGPEDPGDVLAV